MQLTFQAQILAINNGFIVTLPPKDKIIQARSQEEFNAQQRPIYCKDAQAVCDLLSVEMPVIQYNPTLKIS